MWGRMRLPVAALRHEWRPCPLCGADDTSLRFAVNLERMLLSSVWVGGREYQVSGEEYLVACRLCGLCYVNPRLAIDADVNTYSPEAERTYFSATREERARANRALLQQMSRWLGRSPRTLFDFGCGDGLLIEMAAAAGVRAVGYEVSKDLQAWVAELLGEEALVGDDWMALPTASFDVIALINVIEHLATPLEILRGLHRLLTPGGVLVVHAPNFGGLPARLKGATWHQIEPFGHLTYFTAHTMGKMLETAGFQPIGRFTLITQRGARAAIQTVLTRLGIYLDNSLGVAARRCD